MALSPKQTKTGAALIAALLASSGGYAFLHKHPNPTLREVFAACEKGDVRGSACCEDMNQVSDISSMDTMLQQCGMVTPQDNDPFGTRKQEEDDWDKRLAEEAGK